MIIVTGGAGLIGSAFVSYLNKKGRSDILIVDNLASSEKWKNLVGKNYDEYIHKDNFIEELLEGSFPTVEAIIHMGACSSTTELDADYLYNNNTEYTRILMEWSIENNVRFIYASSGATYGDGSKGYSDDHSDIRKLRPLNMYGYSKQLSDEMAYKNGLLENVCSLKFFNVFGPNEYHKGSMTSVVLNSFKQIKESGEVSLFKSDRSDYQDGEQSRDFIYVKDVVKIIYWLLKNPKVNGVYNIGTGNSRTWNDLVKAVFSALDLPVNIKYIDMPEHLKHKYQYYTKADNQKIIDAGWKGGFTTLEDAVKDYVQKYLNKELRIY
ncbi:MAG: ADP-glyceromanno-heptose 6-epimerase [Candidatus Cloacimonetes bacterium 4572_65]|nr:MAG: ADP-glyceromanno-heptose 6-epimerase [Candidatus Cloacimonetes bacterium 4572_65]